ncbi:MAG: RnfABCDGE type electron transport complex subunit D [Clostridiales bacterium]|nr:RnfABCDGE type electron transport complex subunit D [Candidatus Blautia equi]
MSNLYNVSSSPHVRSKLSTGGVMYDVILSLMPATFFGIYHFGFHAFLVVAMAIVTAVLSEYVFDYITGKANTTRDGSAIVTGLLLALCLPASVPLYIPFAGSLFAIVIAKCLFGGLGKNFMNPALAGRCFLLISFSGAVTNYALDGVTGPTPLVDIANGAAVNVWDMFLGCTNGVLGCSILGLLIGGIYLLVVGGITYEIPLSVIVSFSLFVALFGGHGFDPVFILAHICGGGVIMGAFFMATDPVTSPVSSMGQIIYGCVVGILSGLFRTMGSAADSVSYAIIISNLVTPMIDMVVVPKPYGYRANAMVGNSKEKKNVPAVPKSAVVLCVITLIAGVALSGIYNMTKDTIEEQQRLAKAASYKAVVPGAESFDVVEAAETAIADLDGAVYGTDFGKVFINEAYVAKDAAGEIAGYVVAASSNDGFDGTVGVSVGFAADGAINSIEFTELHETAGMGMKCGDPEFKDQFNGRNVAQFTLNKAGGAASAEEINSVSGASVTSGAVVNAVNAALDFFNAYMK